METNKKITVLQFVCGLTSGGVEQVIYNYYRCIDKSKVRFVLAYQHKPEGECLKKMEEIGIECVRITARSENVFKNVTDSYKLIKKYQPDIVHAHMNLVNFCALFPAMFAGVKVRISHSHIAETNKSFAYKVMAFICKKLNILSANSLMACGDEAGKYLYGERAMSKAGKVYVLVNAIDLDRYARNEQMRESVRRELKLEDSFVLGHVGRFTDQKNHTRLIEIFAEVKKARANAKLLLIGAGEKEQEIRTKVSDMKLEEDVIFYGTSSDISGMYSAMDVFVFPSLFEGFPVVAVEVQAAGLPFILSDTVAKTAKLTDSTIYVPLQESNATWAKIILDAFEHKKESDLTELRKQYDIKLKAKELGEFYEGLLAGKRK